MPLTSGYVESDALGGVATTKSDLDFASLTLKSENSKVLNSYNSRTVRLDYEATQESWGWHLKSSFTIWSPFAEADHQPLVRVMLYATIANTKAVSKIVVDASQCLTNVKADSAYDLVLKTGSCYFYAVIIGNYIKETLFEIFIDVETDMINNVGGDMTWYWSNFVVADLPSLTPPAGLPQLLSDSDISVFEGHTLKKIPVYIREGDSLSGAGDEDVFDFMLDATECADVGSGYETAIAEQS